MKTLINYAYNVVIEVTRRCNMNCAHCLRGDAQNLDISTDVIDRFFGAFAYGADISTITFTGGEISLNVQAIEYVLEKAKEKDISISSFYMVTNGKEKETILPLLLASMKWYAYAYDNEVSGLALSKDAFHEKIPSENERMLSAVSYFSQDKNMEDKQNITLINEGHAKDLKNYRKVKRLAKAYQNKVSE